MHIVDTLRRTCSLLTQAAVKKLPWGGGANKRYAQSPLTHGEGACACTMMTAQPTNMRLLHTVMVYAHIAPESLHIKLPHTATQTLANLPLWDTRRGVVVCNLAHFRQAGNPIAGQNWAAAVAHRVQSWPKHRDTHMDTRANDDPECCSPHDCTRTWGHLQMLIATDQRQGNSHTYSTHDNSTSCSAFSIILKYTWRDYKDPPRSSTPHTPAWPTSLACTLRKNHHCLQVVATMDIPPTSTGIFMTQQRREKATGTTDHLAPAILIKQHK